MGAYRIANLVILGFLLYALLFPLLSPVMERLFPDIWRCQYKALTGKPCIFCGLTSDMNHILRGDAGDGFHNRSFPLFTGLYLAEWVIRVLLLTVSGRFAGRSLPVVDLALHGIIGVMVILFADTLQKNVFLPLFV